jgi:ribosomal protein L11
MPRRQIEELTIQEARAIALLISGYSARDVAVKINVTPETISKWQKNPLFAREKQKAINTLYNAAIAELTEGMQLACRELIDIIKDHDNLAKVRVSAINVLLNNVGKHKAGRYLDDSIKSSDLDVDDLTEMAETKDDLVEAISLKLKHEQIGYQLSQKMPVDIYEEGIRTVANLMMEVLSPEQSIVVGERIEKMIEEQKTKMEHTLKK